MNDEPIRISAKNLGQLALPVGSYILPGSGETVVGSLDVDMGDTEGGG